MSTFRNHTPKRSNITAAVATYKDHRNNLRTDFQERCGYCNDLDRYRLTSFEIDHFIPQVKDKKPFLTIKTNTDYSNLVYSCKSCNNAKRNKWPTNDQIIPNRNNEGFVDPCDDDYNNHFERTATGRIIYKTKLGEWQYNNLKLHKPQHEIIWNIELLDKLIDEIEAILEHSPNALNSDTLLLCYRGYRQYVNKLGNIGL